MKLPANCPAFRFRGEVYEGRPGCNYFCGKHGEFDGLTLVDKFGHALAGALLVGSAHEGVKLDTRTFRPLTKAARKLVAWVRQ